MTRPWSSLDAEICDDANSFGLPPICTSRRRELRWFSPFTIPQWLTRNGRKTTKTGGWLLGLPLKKKHNRIWITEMLQAIPGILVCVRLGIIISAMSGSKIEDTVCQQIKYKSSWLNPLAFYLGFPESWGYPLVIIHSRIFPNKNHPTIGISPWLWKSPGLLNTWKIPPAEAKRRNASPGRDSRGRTLILTWTAQCRRSSDELKATSQRFYGLPSKLGYEWHVIGTL